MEMPPRRRNPQGAWGLPVHTASLVVDDAHGIAFLLVPSLPSARPTRATHWSSSATCQRTAATFVVP